MLENIKHDKSMIKDKVLEVLKPLLADKGFKADELEGLADFASKNLKEESTDDEIKNVCDGLVPVASLIQKVGNRYSTEAERKTEKKYEGYIKPEIKEKEIEPTKDIDKTKHLSQEEILRMIDEKAKAITEEALAPYRQKEERQRLQGLLESNDRVKSIPESFRKRYTLDKEENLDSVATQMETDYASLKQELIKSGSFVEPPREGSGGGDGNDLITFMNKMAEKSADKK